MIAHNETVLRWAGGERGEKVTARRNVTLICAVKVLAPYPISHLYRGIVARIVVTTDFTSHLRV